MNRTRKTGPWRLIAAPVLSAWAGPAGCVAASFGRTAPFRTGALAGLRRLRKSFAHGRFRRATRA